MVGDGRPPLAASPVPAVIPRAYRASVKLVFKANATTPLFPPPVRPDPTTRSLLFEAAGVLLFRNTQTSALKEWGLKLARRAGTRKARVAVARKLAILMHRLWINDSVFEAYSTV